jgi:5'-methylthioadenosine phosphorylase
MIGLITGSGFYDLPHVANREEREISTAYGTVVLTTGTWDGVPVAFLPRHGSGHSIPPHAINYRANIAALADIGATSIIATAVSGGINPSMQPGDFVLISDVLNFTSGRADTFFDGSDGTVTHTDMSAPYSTELRSVVRTAARDEDIPLADGGVYCATNGPRFETPAEITMMGRLGGDLVGMTGYPEVILANEAGIPYVSIGVVSNTAAGLGTETLSADDVMVVVERCTEPLHRLIAATVIALGGAS